MIGAKVPVFEHTDAFGNKFNFSSCLGRIIIVSLGDKRSRIEDSFWSSWENLYQLPGGTLFVNVYFPGGLSPAVPRGEVVHRIRRSINERTAEVIATAPAERKKFLQDLEIHWVIDWDRDICGSYYAPRHEIILFLVDRKGKIRDYYLKSECRLDDFLGNVKKVESEK
ncbi:MAG: hypothetical protein PHW04_04590 [Candidatus Wallbacteria bacterium]|nr:hypothetical protein [Candidatus Wallbacteria bacterium]